MTLAVAGSSGIDGWSCLHINLTRCSRSFCCLPGTAFIPTSLTHMPAVLKKARKHHQFKKPRDLFTSRKVLLLTTEQALELQAASRDCRALPKAKSEQGQALLLWGPGLASLCCNSWSQQQAGSRPMAPCTVPD